MYELQGQNQALVEKWEEILEHPDAPALTTIDQKSGVAQLLENTEQYLATEAAPTNVTGGVAKWDPILLSMVRRIGPSIIESDIVGVQAMTAPTGLIFAMRPRYTDQTGAEIHANEPNSAFSGNSSDGTAGHTSPVAADTETDPFAAAYDTGTGRTTAEGEGDLLAQVAMTVDSVSVTAKTRGLNAQYSMELAQDLKAQQGMDADAIFSGLLSESLAADISREIVRTIYKVATVGAQDTTTAGTFDLDNDTSGRWIAEKLKELLLRIDYEANEIFTSTRAGYGNFVIVSPRVFAALANLGVIDYNSGLSGTTVGQDPRMLGAQQAVASGILAGRYKIIRDPYATGDFVVVGYKGANPMEAGLFYAPYVPLYTARVITENNFQPSMGYRTRYGLVANPLAGTNGALTANSNPFYRKFAVAKL